MYLVKNRVSKGEPLEFTLLQDMDGEAIELILEQSIEAGELVVEVTYVDSISEEVGTFDPMDYIHPHQAEALQEYLADEDMIWTVETLYNKVKGYAKKRDTNK